MSKQKPKKQHIVPITYLKQFHIGDNKSIYCIDFEDPYRQFVQKIGFNDRRVKIKNFYTDNRLENPFAIEEYFAKEVEPLYPKIMDVINQEKQLSNDLRGAIILWIYICDLRKPAKRDNYEDILKWSAEIVAKYKKETLDVSELRNHAKKLAKEIQLNPFSDHTQGKSLFDLFVNTLANKQWIILKSTSDNPFFTNDNPVFSPNLHPMFRKTVPYHIGAELNSQSYVYFILSPTYCLEISPFIEGTPFETNLFNMNIPYLNATHQGVDFINQGVHYTRNKLMISNSKDALEARIKFR